MAITLEELQVIVTANSRELTNEMKGVQSKLKNLEKGAAAATGSISTGFIAAASKAAAVTAVIGGVVLAVKKLVDQSKEYIGLQAIQTEAETKLETVMKQRMRATDDMVQAVKDLTAAQQEIGVIGDEVQMAGAQQIATFLKTRSALEELIPAMNNLAAQQMGYNVTAEGTKNIGNMLGKVMQGQTSALTRVGITFSEAEEKALKYGSEAERAAALARIIKNNVGDMNKALADTPNGAIVQLSNNFGDLKETIGGILLPIFASLAKQINELVVLLNNALTRVKEFVETVFGRVFSGTSKAIKSVAAEIRGIGENAEDSADDTVKAAKKIKGALAGIDEINVLKLNDEEGESETGGADDGEIASMYQ